MKLVYTAHYQTRVPTGVISARESPEEPGVYACPADATFFAVPDDIPAGKVAILPVDREDWLIVDDLRGTYYDANNQAVEIDDPRADVAALSKEPRPSVDHVLTDGQWVLDEERRRERLSFEVRAERNYKLDQADVAINRLEDAGQDAKAWRAYRNWLRAIPEQSGFPLEVDWGTPPA